MANRKQAIEVIDKWLHEVDSEILNDKDLDIDEELKFFVREYLDEYYLCNGCRWYFSPDRTCEKPTGGIRACINRMYDHWNKTHNGIENKSQRKPVEKKLIFAKKIPGTHLSTEYNATWRKIEDKNQMDLFI